MDIGTTLHFIDLPPPNTGTRQRRSRIQLTRVSPSGRRMGKVRKWGKEETGMLGMRPKLPSSHVAIRSVTIYINGHTNERGIKSTNNPGILGMRPKTPQFTCNNQICKQGHKAWYEDRWNSQDKLETERYMDKYNSWQWLALYYGGKFRNWRVGIYNNSHTQITEE